MTITELLVQFKNPEVIKTLGFGDKMVGVGVTVIMGMGITFVALILLQYIIQLLTFVLKEEPSRKRETVIKRPENAVSVPVERVRPKPLYRPHLDKSNDDEIVAAIMAALMVQLGQESKFVITEIKRVKDNTPVWSRAGLVDQLSNRF